MVYTSNCNQPEVMIKGVITLRRYHFYAAAICAAAVIGTSGCSMNTKAEGTQTQAEMSQTEASESATVVEAVTGPIESMEEKSKEDPQALRIYGSALHMEDGRLSIDNQSGVSFEGEIILNISQESTRILDAASGAPLALEDIEDGETIYVYVGPTMTMSLPPMTNADIILADIPADFKVPDYVEIDSVVTDAESSQTVLTALDGTEYVLAEDCDIFPYLTRNMVTLDDLTQGKKVIVWSGDDNTATRIMVFAD